MPIGADPVAGHDAAVGRDDVTADVDCVVPTHGRPQYLAEALAAIAAQTRPPAQVIVVSDDGNPASSAVVDRLQVDHPGLRRSPSSTAPVGSRVPRPPATSVRVPVDHR